MIEGVQKGDQCTVHTCTEVFHIESPCSSACPNHIASSGSCTRVRATHPDRAPFSSLTHSLQLPTALIGLLLLFVISLSVLQARMDSHETFDIYELLVNVKRRVPRCV